MSSLLGALIQNVAEYFLGESIESVGGLAHSKPVRAVVFVLAVALAIWIAFASAFLWTSGHVPGVAGLWPYAAQSGGPFWMLATPILAGLVVLALILPGGGKFSLVTLFSAATFALALASLASFQGGGQYQVNTAAVSSVIGAILLPILALVLAVGDVPPLDAPLARFSLMYWSRYKHLLALRSWGAERGFKVIGPEGPQGTLTLHGFYDQYHPLTITSSVTLKLSSSNTASYSLSIKEGSPCDITAFRISYEPVPKKLRGSAVASESRIPRKLPITFYLIPATGQTIPQTFVARMAALVEAGRLFLRKGDFVHATPFGLRYTHLSARGLSSRDAQLEPVVKWMHQLMALMEEVSPQPASGMPPSQGDASSSTSQ